ncbi:MAG: hypothetical protein KKF62_10605 [Bacteroidetes bacterium]|nr:hypothetical protein [Bacteroidota bacterium]MBU1113507.1 hypothetical protein [Bacteroidota bacterium]MBU1797043.1 hypothetical protein [Bacteroidota bacterium]
MLDNPNLTQEVIFDLMSDGKDIIGISLIVVVIIIIYINRYQVALFLKYGFSNNKNDISPFGGLFGLLKTDISELAKKDLENKVDNLLQEYNNIELDNNTQLDGILGSDISQINQLPPIFRSLKVKRTSNEIVYYFVNDGGAIRDIKIKSKNGVNITIEPQNYLEEKGSGYFQFVFDNNREKEFHFILSYYNSLNKYCEVKYYYSLNENQLMMYKNES